MVEAIKAAGGKPVVLAVAGEETSAAGLEELFTTQREAEWGEFLSDCGGYETELAGEVVKGKLTLPVRALSSYLQCHRPRRQQARLLGPPGRQARRPRGDTGN